MGDVTTYTLSTKSGMMVMTGINMRPSQKAAEENNIMYIPSITLPSGIIG